MKKISIILIAVLLSSIVSKADEGMWIPMLLKKYNIEDMQKKGFKLTAEDIYSVNKSSLKDAIVIFGRGCTGEIISDEGLLITNHHCGYSQIQSHSSVDHDYLTDGFWAYNKSEELVNQGLSATFLIRMEDVTKYVLDEISDNLTERERKDKIKTAFAKLEKENSEEGKYKIVTKPFFYGNEYYMFVYQEYTDVRLVGAPPSAIGKFGGDTDNWMWPRHTGDFSMFRIYADKDNNPAKFSKDNVPYKPKRSLDISLKGVKKGDFTFVFGYPGTTMEYLTSYAVKMISGVENPHKINLRDKRLAIMRAEMDKSTKVRIQYSTKYARVANAWKKWIGENRGLMKLNAIEKKQNLESEFTTWVNTDVNRTKEYGTLLNQYKDIYSELSEYKLAQDYVFEAAFATEIVMFTRNFNALANYDNISKEQQAKAIERLRKSSDGFYKDFYMPIDKKTFSTLMPLYKKNIDAKYHPKFFSVVDKKYKGDFNKYAEFLFSKSVLANKEKFNTFLDKFSYKKALKDPAFIIYNDIKDVYLKELNDKIIELNDKLSLLNRKYMKALMEFQKDKIFYPDANFTLRVAFGQVDDYFPKDGVKYDYYTTLDGIIEKDDPEIYDYRVPEKLKELYNAKDYGRYAENGKMHVCFTASNHTTGGNSGSPVLNANGELIGLNFDRNWEGTMSDIMYDPDQCRNITLDIRYALFIIDKFAGAKNLIDEMNIVE